MTPVTQERIRLGSATLGRVAGASVPTYDRPDTAAVAHLGVGAFARAHLALYADDLLRRGVPASIRGVSLHSAAAQEQLDPQNGLFTVCERDPDVGDRLRVVGSLSSVSTGVPAALEAVTASTTRLVTLTITEKGYDSDPAELEDPHAPRTVAGVLAKALARRRATGLGPLVVASLDNVAANGDLMRTRVSEVAAALDPDLAEWIAAEVRFPNSVVDRMVPATTPDDIARIGDQIGLVDLGAVTTERHRSWIASCDEELAIFAAVGTELVEDLTPYEHRKLWLLNGPHSALAYGGLLLGHPTIAGAATDQTVARFTRGLVSDVLQIAELPDHVQPQRFADDALRRFANPHLRHSCAQVGADGSRKLPQRFGAVITARQEAGLATDRFAVVVAVWVAAMTRIPVMGRQLARLEDPEASRIPTAGGRDLGRIVELALGDRFDRTFAADVARSLEMLTHRGSELLETLA